MSQLESPHPAAIRNIFHPSDFTKASENAFQHALKLALVAKAGITVMHVTDGEHAQWSEFPGVRHWLERWSMIPPGSGRDAVTDLGLAVQKVMARSNDSLRACLHYIDKHPSELIVLATRNSGGRSSGPHPSPIEPIGRGLHQLTLLLQENVRGFVNPDDGALQLNSILVPIAGSPNPQSAVNAAARFALACGLEELDFHVLHVGTADTTPFVTLPARPGWNWEFDARPGVVVDEIVAAAERRNAGLIVMATAGHHGFMDALRGSTSEEILRRSPCAVLTVAGHTSA